MIAVIMVSYRYKMNPDNLATPLAASIGDVVSISILSFIASQFYLKLNDSIWILYVVLAVFLVLLPIWILIVLKNKYTRSVLKSGWIPILSALLISGLVQNTLILLSLAIISIDDYITDLINCYLLYIAIFWLIYIFNSFVYVIILV